MLVEAEAVRVFNRQSFEFVIISHLMAGGHFVSTNWYGLAVDLNSSDGVDKPVKFKEILWWWLDFNTGLRYENIINLIFILGILILLIFLDSFLFGFDEDFIGLADKHSTELVNIIAVFFLYFGELGKVKIASAAPIKSLSWELITSFKI